MDTKTELRIKKFIIIHGDKYDYSKFVFKGYDQKGTIICKKHGEFFMTAKSHNRGTGCTLCAVEYNHSLSTKNIDKFIEESNLVHNNKYDYSKFTYINSHTKSTIICPEHGEFKQSPNSHFHHKHGCYICSKEKADKLGWSKTKWVNNCYIKNLHAKLYIIKLYNDLEEFIKVGITSNPRIHDRVGRIPYKYEIIKVVIDTPENIWNLENKIKRDYRKINKYRPLIEFKGMYECYNINLLKILEKIENK